jgi:hypothetical protein
MMETEILGDAGAFVFTYNTPHPEKWFQHLRKMKRQEWVLRILQGDGGIYNKMRSAGVVQNPCAFVVAV